MSQTPSKAEYIPKKGDRRRSATAKKDHKTAGAEKRSSVAEEVEGVYKSGDKQKTKGKKKRRTGIDSPPSDADSQQAVDELLFLPADKIGVPYYEQVDANLHEAGELLDEHTRSLVWNAVDVIGAIPEYYPPLRYATKLCQCNTCCERCCVDPGHRETGFHRGRDGGTGIALMTGEDAQGDSSDSSGLSLPYDGYDVGGPNSRVAAAAREARRAIRCARQFRAASQTIDSLECSNESENQMRKLYTRELTEKAVFYAQKAREALARYRSLRRLLQDSSMSQDGAVGFDPFQDLDGSQFQGAQPPQRIVYGPMSGANRVYRSPGPGWHLGYRPDASTDARRFGWSSASVIGRSPSLESALSLSRKVDVVLNRAQQAAKEAYNLQRASAEALAEAKVAEGIDNSQLRGLPRAAKSSYVNLPTRMSATDKKAAVRGGSTSSWESSETSELKAPRLSSSRSFEHRDMQRSAAFPHTQSQTQLTAALESKADEKPYIPGGRRASMSETTEKTYRKGKSLAARRASVGAGLLLKAGAQARESYGSLAMPPEKEEQESFKAKAASKPSVSLQGPQHSPDRASEQSSFTAKAMRRASVGSNAFSAVEDNRISDQHAFRAKAMRRASVSSKGSRRSQEDAEDPDALRARARRKASISAKKFATSPSDDEGSLKAKASRRASVYPKALPAHADDVLSNQEPFKAKAARRASVSGKAQHAKPGSFDVHDLFKAKAARRASVSSARKRNSESLSPEKEFNKAKTRRASISSTMRRSLPDGLMLDARTGSANGTKPTAVLQPDASEAFSQPVSKPPRRPSVSAAKFKRLYGNVSDGMPAEEDSRSRSGGQLVIKVKPLPVLTASKKVGTPSRPEKRNFFSEVRDLCCSSISSPAELEKVINEGVRTPKRSKTLGQTKMVHDPSNSITEKEYFTRPRPELFYDPSNESLDIEMIASDRCKSTQLSLPYGKEIRRKNSQGITKGVHKRKESVTKQRQPAPLSSPEGNSKAGSDKRPPKGSERGSGQRRLSSPTNVQGKKKGRGALSPKATAPGPASSPGSNKAPLAGKGERPTAHGGGLFAMMKLLPSDTYVVAASTAVAAGGDMKDAKVAKKDANKNTTAKKKKTKPIAEETLSKHSKSSTGSMKQQTSAHPKPAQSKKKLAKDANKNTSAKKKKKKTKPITEETVSKHSKSSTESTKEHTKANPKPAQSKKRLSETEETAPPPVNGKAASNQASGKTKGRPNQADTSKPDGEPEKARKESITHKDPIKRAGENRTAAPNEQKDDGTKRPHTTDDDKPRNLSKARRSSVISEETGNKSERKPKAHKKKRTDESQSTVDVKPQATGLKEETSSDIFGNILGSFGGLFGEASPATKHDMGPDKNIIYQEVSGSAGMPQLSNLVRRWSGSSGILKKTEGPAEPTYASRATAEQDTGNKNNETWIKPAITGNVYDDPEIAVNNLQPPSWTTRSSEQFNGREAENSGRPVELISLTQPYYGEVDERGRMGFNRYSWETSSRGSRHSTELSADARSEEDYRRNAFEGAPSDEKIFPQIIIADEGGTSLGDGGTVLEVELVGDDTVDEVHSQHGHMDDDASVYSLQPGEPIELGALLQEEGGNYDLSEAEEDSAELLPDSPSYTQDEFPTDRGSQRRLSLSRDILQLQNTNYELQARPHAPIRGPDTQDTNFWDLDWPPVLYPESRLVFALALVAGAWVLYLLLTTWRHVDKRSFLDSFRPLTPEINLPHARLLTAPPSLGHFPTEQVGDTEVETRTSAQPQSYQSCGTPNCKREASYPKNLLGENPCLNFYSSICNKQNRDENPAQGSSPSSDALMADNAVKIVADYILDKNHQDMNAARDLVEACINHERDEDWSRAELNELFFEYFGSSWPIENKRPTMGVVWAVAGSLALDIKLEVLARVSVQVHPENSSEYIPAIDEPVPLYRDGDFEEPAYSYLLESAVEESFRLTSPAANDGRHASYASGIKRTMQLLSKLSANASSAQPIGPRIYRLSRVRLLLPSVWSFVRAVFLHPSKVADNAAILIKSPRFFENFESAQESQFEPQAILNYIGFRVVVYFAAFLQLPSVRRLRVLEANFMLPDNASAREFCTREMERLFPALYARAFMMQLRNPSVLPSMWSPALKSKFAEGLETVTFVWTSKLAPDDDLRNAKLKLANLTINNAAPSWILNNSVFSQHVQQAEQQLHVTLNLDPSNSLKRFRFFARLLRQHELHEARRGAMWYHSSMSVFDTLAKYDRHTNKVYVPLGIVNYSTPVNSTEFAIHAARYAVRFFKALVPVLYPNYARTLGQRRDSWLYSKQYQGRFEAAVDCLLTQYHNTNEDLKSTFLRTLADRTSAGPALMEQTLALMQAYSAFKELLNNQRTQHSDFRMAGLQGGTPEQLFFVAYAQDNCDASDNVHRRRQFHADISQLPPEDRVNFPLTQLEAFARAFACNRTESMVANKRCPIIRTP